MGSNSMSREWCILALLSACLLPAQTTVADVVYHVDGTIVQQGIGTAKLSEPCRSPSGLVVPEEVDFHIKDGNLRLSLWPNDACVPAGTFYIVRFKLDGGTDFQVEWSIPTSEKPVDVAEILMADAAPEEWTEWWVQVAVALSGAVVMLIWMFFVILDYGKSHWRYPR